MRIIFRSLSWRVSCFWISACPTIATNATAAKEAKYRPVNERVTVRSEELGLIIIQVPTTNLND